MTFISYLNTQNSEVKRKSIVSVNKLPGNRISTRLSGGSLCYPPPHLLKINQSQKYSHSHLSSFQLPNCELHLVWGHFSCVSFQSTLVPATNPKCPDMLKILLSKYFKGGGVARQWVRVLAALGEEESLICSTHRMAHKHL